MTIIRNITSPTMVLSLLIGLFLGAFFWLWANYGSQVLLGYIQGIALSCF
jgi:hypothetical protein